MTRIGPAAARRAIFDKGVLALLAGAWLFDRTCLPAAEPPVPKFRAVEIDSNVAIGYGVAIADVDGDGKPDILLADKKQIVWYQNPGWQKFVIAENLTELDNVCIAAADIHGDGKAEVAVGAGWNPGDTLNSGAVFYLVPPKDRKQKWEPVELPHEPTVHRMRWLRNARDGYDLVVVPLHGRGNQNGTGAGVKVLTYEMPADPHGAWKTKVANDSLHLTHNFDLVQWHRQRGDELLLAGKEGVFHLVRQSAGWTAQQVVGKIEPDFAGAGEVRAGKLPGGGLFLATVEPMHGNQLAVYTPPGVNDSSLLWRRHLLDASLKEGHALACGDLLGAGFDQVVVGWRAKDGAGKVGIKFFVPLDATGQQWHQSLVDDNTMACEDLRLADLNGDGKLDIVASGRATRNLKVYFNEVTR